MPLYIWVKCYDFKWGPCFTEWTHLAKTFDLQVWPGPHRVVGCRLTQTVETWGTTFRGNGETERKREERRGNWKGERKNSSRKRYFQSLSLFYFLFLGLIFFFWVSLCFFFLFLGWFTSGQNPFGLIQVGRKPIKLCYPSGMHALHGT